MGAALYLYTDRAAAVMAGADGGGANRGGGSSWWRRQRLCALALCSGDAGLAGAWLEEAQGSAVQAGQNQGSAREGRREMM